MVAVLKHLLVAIFAIGVFYYGQRYIASKALPKPRVGGYFHPAFRNVAETFKANIESGFEVGASFSVYKDGQALVDLHGGMADIEAHRHWDEQTMTHCFSVTKGVSALAIGRLVDSGHLDYKKEVRHYWPEFGTEDKKNVTVEMMLSHQAGLIILDEPVSLLDYKHNWAKVEKILALQKPFWPPGQGVGYHTLTWGMYADALVRRVDPQGRNLSEFFRQEVAEPFGIDFNIGLSPEKFHRVARFKEFSLLDMRYDPWTILGLLSNTNLWASAKSVNLGDNNALLLDPSMMVGVPSAVGLGSARDLSLLYSYVANGGSVGGRRLLNESTVKLLSMPVTEGLKNYLLITKPVSRGLFITLNRQGHKMVGHSGYGGNYAGANMDLGLGVSYVTNHLSLHLLDDPRMVTLMDAFYGSYDKYLKMTS